MSLVEKIRKAREQRVEVGGHVFIIRRPTQMEWVEIVRANASQGRAMLPFVVGWDKVTSLDLIAGGDGAALDFDPDIRDEWLLDRLDLLAPLTDAVKKAYTDDEARRAEAKKN